VVLNDIADDAVLVKVPPAPLRAERLRQVQPGTDVARHVIQRTLNPRHSSSMASYDVASDARQTVP